MSAAAGLRERGLGRGDVVLATMRNTPEHVFLWLGSAYAGTILCTANPASSEAELEGLAAQVEPKLVLADDDVATLLRELGPTKKLVGTRRGPDDPAVLIPTSGTTGRSKIVTQTHRAYVLAGRGLPVVDGAHGRTTG